MKLELGKLIDERNHRLKISIFAPVFRSTPYRFLSSLPTIAILKAKHGG